MNKRHDKVETGEEATFHPPDPAGEALAMRIVDFLYEYAPPGYGSAAELRAHAEAKARDLAQVILWRFEVTERTRP